MIKVLFLETVVDLLFLFFLKKKTQETSGFYPTDKTFYMYLFSHYSHHLQAYK